MSGFQMKEAAEVRKYMIRGAQFMFIPYPSLVEMVVKNEHPYVIALPIGHKLAFLKNSPIRFEGEYVLKYYEGRCDIRNNFILDKGDIKIIPPQLEKPKELIEAEDDEVDEVGEDLGNGWKILE